jgi:hypothetical protein
MTDYTREPAESPDQAAAEATPSHPNQSGDRRRRHDETLNAGRHMIHCGDAPDPCFWVPNGYAVVKATAG